MRPTLRNCAAAAAAAHNYKPLIRFVGKRRWPAAPSPPAPHPAGPPEYQAHFSEFITKFKANQSHLAPSTSSMQTTSTSTPARSGKPAATSIASGSAATSYRTAYYDEFLKAPTRFMNPPVRRLGDEEIEAIQSGGASML